MKTFAEMLPTATAEMREFVEAYKRDQEEWHRMGCDGESPYDLMLATPPAKEPVSNARQLFEVGHAVSPFMTLESGPDGCGLRMQFASLADGQAMHTALVRFFKEA